MDIINAYKGRSHVHRLIGMFEQAEKDLDTMTELSGNKRDLTEALIEKANMFFRQGRVDECEQAARKAIKLGKRLNMKDLVAEAHIPLAQAIRARGDYKKASLLLEESIDIFSNSTNNKGLFKAKRIYTHMLSSKGEFNKAIDMLSEMKANHWDSINLHDRTSILTNLATCYSQIGELDKAIELYKYSINLKELIGDKVGISICYYSLSFTYYMKYNYKEALKCAEKSLEICTELKDISGISYAYISIASINKKQGNFLKAIKCHEKSMQVGEPMNDLHMILSNSIDLGYLYIDTGDFLKADKLIAEINRKIRSLANPYYKCALLKLKIASCRNRHEYSKIKKYAKQGIAIAEKSGMKNDYYDFLATMVEFDESSANKIHFDELYSKAYLSGNISLKIISLPSIIMYKLNNNHIEEALQYSEEYIQLVKKLHESVFTVNALYVNAKIKKLMRIPINRELKEAKALAVKYKLKPLLKKIGQLDSSI